MKNVYILISNAREQKNDEQKYIVQGDIDINKIRIYFYLTERVRVKKYSDLE